MKTFEVRKYEFEPDWDNIQEQCHVCDKILLRSLPCCRWVYTPHSEYPPVTLFFVCSEECANMFILQKM